MAVGEIKSINKTYNAELSNSTSNTINDIYARLDNLTAQVDTVFGHIDRIDMAMSEMEQKIEQMWQPPPEPEPTAYPVRSYNRLLVMSGDEPNLPADVITIDTGALKSFRVIIKYSKIIIDN